MTRPDDIPLDIWSVAATMAGEYLSWLDAGNSSGHLSEHASDAMADTIARAIMAEREACAEAATQLADRIGASHFVAVQVATAIRNRGA